MLATLTAWSAVAVAPRALAQSSGRIWRVGFLALRRPVSLKDDQFGAFPAGLRELGYVEGKNLVIEWRFADGKSERLAALAAELASSKVDAILAAGTQAISAAQKATRTIPIVMAGANDPVGSGFVASLARPGGNITGLSLLLEDVTPKQLDLLREMLPGLTRAGLLANPANAAYAALQANVRAAAKASGVDVVTAQARSAAEIEGAIETLVQGRAKALIVVSDALFTQEMRRIAQLAERARLPAVAPFRQYAQAGVLMSYGENFTEHFRRTAAYVGRILKGATPADLPVEQPSKFELAINLKTARALGLKVPQALLLRADAVIE